jgi:hypothetical protein
MGITRNGSISRASKFSSISACCLAAFWGALACPLAADSYDVQLSPALYGNLCQLDMSVYPSWACGPASTANELAYMQHANSVLYPGLLPASDYAGLVSLGNTLAGPSYMATDNINGTWHDTLIAATVSYIESRSPGCTTYAAQDYWSWVHKSKPSWVQSGTPTWEFLLQDLQAHDAIDILLTYHAGGGHYVTVNGLTWNDADADDIIDSTENARLYFMNPWTGQEANAHLWQTSRNGTLETDYSSSWVSTIFAATVPEPATLLLLACGGMALMRRKRN